MIPGAPPPPPRAAPPAPPPRAMPPAAAPVAAPPVAAPAPDFDLLDFGGPADVAAPTPAWTEIVKKIDGPVNNQYKALMMGGHLRIIIWI